ncbi:uncharacterized protein LOC143857543 [Tasmannia lanceolata]|uniref:uncharacterized protein LOC143857543 n=1 Tax=Tasmannia lanceolata TaxID=3420 RepID=UPI0040632C80
MLLNIVRGSLNYEVNYEDIRTINGILYPDFKSACSAFGLLEDDSEWHEALEEASVWATSHQLLHLFASILVSCAVTNPLSLWEGHYKDLADDLQSRAQKNLQNPNYLLPEHVLQEAALQEIESILNAIGKSLSDYPSMPQPQSNDQHEFENKSILEELGYDRAAAKIEFNRLHRHLTSEQLSIFNTIMDSCINDAGGFYFVYGSGGTGKTFLWKTLINKLRSDGKIVLSIASSSIAAILLPGGRTSHSRFKIPLNPPDDSTCMIKPRSELAVLIKKATLIIWDEAPMMHRYAIEAVDRTLKDVLKDTSDGASKVLGGKTFVLGGDFRQILPVVPKASREIIVASCLQKSYLWDYCKLFRLTTNIQVLQQGMSSTKRNEVTAFANWLLNIGNGSLPTISIDNHSEADWIRIPDDMLIDTYDNGIIQLITIIYPDFLSRLHEDNYLEQRAILAPKNDDVDYVNSLMLQMLPGDIRTYLSADSAVNKSNDVSTELLTTPEYLNSLNFSGIPKHCLELKVGVPVILLRNLNPAVGLCNGTRLIVLRLERRTIQASIITGNNRNDIHCIPRIVMSPSDREWPFTFKRRQFPLKIAFAMTINKSQGQTLSKVGVYLPKPVFTHGQLYVALSHVTSRSGVKILLGNKDHPKKGYTKNVVYREVLQGISSMLLIML